MFPVGPLLLPPLAPLYAEVHYRFRYFFSLLAMPEPEILADAPHRIDPGQAIPILLLVKDADRYPVRLLDVVVHVMAGPTLRKVRVLSEPVSVRDRWWWTVVEVPVDDVSGWVTCDVQFTYDAGQGPRVASNDNYRTTGHGPLRVYVSPDPLPALPHVLLGEGHSHSTATDDQVEYGVPPGAARALSKRMGLHFAAITDHSYDLDDSFDSYLVNDPDVPKWQALQREVAALNDIPGFTLVPGEEVTCRNDGGRNVHCLVLGDPTFHPGSGDSAERWLHTESELTLRELLDRVHPGAAVVAAHPRERVPFLQWLLLRRGSWSGADESQEGLHALQFWNGTFDARCIAGRDAWVRQLLMGRRLGIIGGNDAHGNFNRFRQLSIPFVKLREADHQLFGRVRTGVFAESNDVATILDAIRRQRTIATDGPVATVTDLEGRSMLGERRAAPSSVRWMARTSPEFGPFHRIELRRGIIGAKTEEVVHAWDSPGTSYWVWRFHVTERSPHYLRLEVTTSGGQRDEQPHTCLTSPVWFNT